MGTLIGMNISRKRGTAKEPVKEIMLLKDFGLEGDAHGGSWHRQVSILRAESIEAFKEDGAEVSGGDFGENLIISGMKDEYLAVGTRIRIGEALLEVSQLGKECHSHCHIHERMGRCIMPEEGIFAVVLKGGRIRTGDAVELIKGNLYTTMRDRNEKEEAFLVTVIDGIDAGRKIYVSGGVIRFGMEAGDTGWVWEAISRGVCNQVIIAGERKVFIQGLGRRPRLIFLGGGHVACAAVSMAKLLDFEIWGLEDRQEYAEHLKAAGVDHVICSDFRTGLRKVPEGRDNYFICMTRGHEYDRVCLEEILKGSYAYVGMMGSKGRARMVRDQLMEQGFSKEAVEQIHAPIGLSIGAQTPAEIAISVLGEIIEEKSRNQASSFDAKLLEALADGSKRGILCTILEKHGSAPRQTGTMMLVRKDTAIGTIGGGLAEHRIISRCRKALEEEGWRREILTVDMTAQEAAKEGMVCGGTIKVLLEEI